MLAKQLSGAAAAAVPAYIEDVFSTWLYTGNGSTQTITNGIDLAGKGGLVWIKTRSAVTDHFLFDTARGTTKELNSNTTDAQATLNNSLTAFNADGFSIGAATGIGTNATIYAAWTFREQSKFFDIVTYTGNGSNRTISHNLGSVPGCIIVKRTDTTGDWQVYHHSLANTEYLVLNTTAAKATGTTRWNSTTPTSTVFSLGTDSTVNANGGTYVAYLFAHNAWGFGASGAENVISCGSWGGDGFVSIGYEPQYILFKRTDSAEGWYVQDVVRGMSQSTARAVYPHNQQSEAGGVLLRPAANGFTVGGTAAESAYIYLAIRRGPMKTPTDATKVFQPTVYTGTNVDNRLVDTTIAPDMVFVRQRNDTVLGGMVVGDRLRGQQYLLTGTTAAEVNDANAFDQQIVSGTEYGSAFSAMNGFWCGNDATAKLNANTTSNNHIAEAFKRAPGFFDVVCYTGTGIARTVAHNLGVIPELMIVKNRSSAIAWNVYVASVGNTKYLQLNATDAPIESSGRWNNTSPTSSVFTVGTSLSSSGDNYVAYLFASLSGISKVGSYTGTGASLTINCGFTSGARFVLIKRTDGPSGWYVWDSARGISSSNDPYLLLNSTAAEVTSTNWIDTDSTGFKLTNAGDTEVNILNWKFIFLAIA